MKKKKVNIAIFPAGSEIGLEIHNSLKYSTFIEVFGFSSVSNHARFVFKNYIEDIPYITDKNFFKKINYYLDRYNIRFIFPALDDVQLFLVKNQDKINAKIISPSLETVEICRSKRKTYSFFQEEKFVPQIFKKVEDIENYPVFVKPDVGQGSQGAKLISSSEELVVELSKGLDMVICENLPGEEYTIDCFTNDKKEIIALSMRNRKRIKSGISVSSEILKAPKEVIKIANVLNERLNFYGVWFFQLKKNARGEYILLEVAPRVAGTMGITRNTGTNYALMTVFLFLGFDVKVIKNNYDIEVDRSFVSRYKISIEYDVVYVDLDDTLIVNDKINAVLINFLYQAKDDKKKIILITKHKIDPKVTLNCRYIDINLFDEIIWIEEKDDKSKYISHKKALFIDDSFSERLNVFSKTGIPVFDCSEVEALLDWRM